MKSQVGPSQTKLFNKVTETSYTERILILFRGREDSLLLNNKRGDQVPHSDCIGAQYHTDDCYYHGYRTT